MIRSLTERGGRLFRTAESLHPLQILGRPAHVALARWLRAVPSGLPPAIRDDWAAPPPALRDFAESEKKRYAARRPHLPLGSSLLAYEDQYGLELGGADFDPLRDWRSPVAVRAYPASVRARRLAVAARLGHRGTACELARAARAVLVQLEVHLLGNHLLENGFGLACAGAVADGPEAQMWWAVGASLLDWQLPHQFLADGGHFERSASYHVALVAALLETLSLADAAGRRVPRRWRKIARDALRWSQDVRAPDGTYPLFNDAGLDTAPTIDQVLELARGTGITASPSRQTLTPSLRVLESTGWVIAATPEAWLCVDAGPDGALEQPGHAHADALTFELFVNGARAIVDYGVSSYANDLPRQQTRSTRVHNTVELEGYDSSEVWHAFRVGRRTRGAVISTSVLGGEITVHVSHDGYRWLPGRPVHHRVFSLRGQELHINDWVEGGAHRGISSIRLDAETESRIRVRSEGAPFTSFDSVWHAQFARPRRATVVQQDLPADSHARWQIQW